MMDRATTPQIAQGNAAPRMIELLWRDCPRTWDPRQHATSRSRFRRLRGSPFWTAMISFFRGEFEDCWRRPTTGILSDRHFEPWRLDLEQFVLGNIGRHGVLRKELGFLKPLIRRSFLDHHHLRYNDALRLGEDYALYARALALRARFLVVPAEGYVSVLRRDSISARHDKRDLERFRDSDLELTAHQSLTPRERRALKRHYSSVDCRVQWLTVIEAVKCRGYVQFIAAFSRSPRVSLFLMMHLFQELSRRLAKAIRT
jgi:succinoglycan biosynthesis protein ExoU